jgi:hypothetical protein
LFGRGRRARCTQAPCGLARRPFLPPLPALAARASASVPLGPRRAWLFAALGGIGPRPDAPAPALSIATSTLLARSPHSVPYMGLSLATLPPQEGLPLSAAEAQAFQEARAKPPFEIHGMPTASTMALRILEQSYAKCLGVFECRHCINHDALRCGGRSAARTLAGSGCSRRGRCRGGFPVS